MASTAASRWLVVGGFGPIKVWWAPYSGSRLLLRPRSGFATHRAAAAAAAAAADDSVASPVHIIFLTVFGVSGRRTKTDCGGPWGGVFIFMGVSDEGFWVMRMKCNCMHRTAGYNHARHVINS